MSRLPPPTPVLIGSWVPAGYQAAGSETLQISAANILHTFRRERESGHQILLVSTNVLPLAVVLAVACQISLI